MSEQVEPSQLAPMVCSKLSAQLEEFHRAFGHVDSDGPPEVPAPEAVRLRARLIIEEAFEAMEAMFSGDKAHLSEVKNDMKVILSTLVPKVDMVALADALGDTDYVVEGTRRAFGINGDPIADEIHRANMAKVGGKKDEHGKTLKPEGWTPPDIYGELRRQGWKG